VSLAGLLNETLYIYRQAAGTNYPFNDGTWSLVATLPCYVSDETIKSLNEDGVLQEVNLTRFRIEPYSFQKNDEIYYNSLFWERLSYEEFDRLGREAVIRCQVMNLNAAQIAERIGS